MSCEMDLTAPTGNTLGATPQIWSIVPLMKHGPHPHAPSSTLQKQAVGEDHEQTVEYPSTCEGTAATVALTTWTPTC